MLLCSRSPFYSQTWIQTQIMLLRLWQKKGLGMIKVVKLEGTPIDGNGFLPVRRFGLDETDIYVWSFNFCNEWWDLLKNIDYTNGRCRSWLSRPIQTIEPKRIRTPYRFIEAPFWFLKKWTFRKIKVISSSKNMYLRK